VASSLGTSSRLVIPENGLISLNIPLTPLRLGALSTHTTHPHFMERYQALLDLLHLNVKLENPYRFKTKGEMVQECKNQIALKACIDKTMSCAHPTASRYLGRAPTHCGRCVPCLVRRAAIEHALGTDSTKYIVNVRQDKMDPTTAQGRDVRAFELAIKRLNKEPDSARLLIHKSGPLPPEPGQLSEYAGVYQRGMKELSNLLGIS
jgi:hypothetical protein